MRRQAVELGERVRKQISVNVQEEKAAEKECKARKDAQNKLTKARGEETEALEEQAKALAVRRQENLTAFTEKNTELKPLSELRFDSWDAARAVRDRLQAEADRLNRKIADAMEEKTEAEKA